MSGEGVCRGAAGSRAQGTWIQFDVRVEATHILEVRFLAYACPHTIAVSSWVAETAVGLNVQAALPESVQSIRERFGVPIEKLGRLLTVEDAWIMAMHASI